MRLPIGDGGLNALALMALLVCVVIAGQCRIAAGYKSEIEITPSPLDEPTTKKSSWFGGFKKFFGSSSESSTTTTTTTSTTTTTTTKAPPRAAADLKPLVISHAPLMPLGPRPDTPSSSPVGSRGSGGPQWPAAAAGAGTGAAPHNLPANAVRTQGAAQAGGANSAVLPPGFASYRPKQPQPSGVDLSYGGAVPPGAHAARPNAGFAPLTSSTSTTSTTSTTTTTPRPKTPSLADTFGLPAKKENLPSTPTPRSPTLKEDFPALPTPKSPSVTPSTPTSPTAWQQPLPTPKPTHTSTPTPTPTPASKPSTAAAGHGHGVSFVPHSEGSTSTTVRPGFASTGNSVASDDEIRQLTEQLYQKESSQLQLVNVNLQGRTRSIDSADSAPEPLLRVDERALQSPTIAKMRLLFNNYEDDTLVNEHVTANERKEENEFLDAVMASSVMRQAMLFLQQKGVLGPDPKTHRDLVKELWFTQYSRGQGKIGSSGFEHVFVHEVKNGTIIGFHNWVYVNEEEKAGRFNYMGHIKELDLGTKGKVLKIRFTHKGLNKPVDTMFVGTSPELELALYTVCFQLRTDRSCPVSLGGSKFSIIVYSWRYRGKNLIGSAYPEI